MKAMLLVALVTTYICKAHNGLGYVFEAAGTDAIATQKAAVDKCYAAHSHRCYEMGCKVSPK